MSWVGFLWDEYRYQSLDRRSLYGFRRILSLVIIATAVLCCASCGGGGALPFLQQQQPPPPPADFTLALSSTSITISQGANSAPINVSIAASNGFSGSVQVTLSGLPTGVSSNPASPFAVGLGTNTAVVFGAASSAATGNFTVSAQAVSGSLSHSASLALTIQAALASNLPRTVYVRTDSLLELDGPPSEPPHRHIVYDSARKHVFVANRAMNRVEVFSTVDQTRIAQISVPGGSSADLSADGTTLWVGTITEQAVAIDAASLQVKSHTTVPPVTSPNAVFDRPEEIVTLANGKAMMRLRQSAAPQALLALWDPSTNTLVDLTSTSAQLFQSGVGAMARTGDRTKLFVAVNDSSGELAVFDGNGNILVGPHGLGTGRVPLVAANPDGSRFALEFNVNGAVQLMLFDGALTQLAALASQAIRGIAFSRDGKFLYVSGTASGPTLSVFDGMTLQFLGQVPDPSIQGVPTQIEEADETKLLFGIANRGISFIDAATPGTLSATAPSFVVAPAAQPSDGVSAGGTSTSVSGQNFESSARVKFGQQVATSALVVSSTQLQATSPPSVISGAVNITAFFPSGWMTLAPDAFSYGPQILRVLPNAGVKTGGDIVQIYGYGFGSDASKISLKIGGAAANIQNVENITSIAPSLALDSTYPFSIQRITLQTPAGNPGDASLDIASPSGSTTLANAFHYFQSHLYSQPRPCKFLLYDQKRQWIYLSAVDRVEVFDLNIAQFHSTPLYPPGGPLPNSWLRGLSLIPDGTQLVVADFGAQNIYLLNPDTGSGTTVPVGGVAGFLNSGPARVAATSAHTVFVGMSGEGGSSGACSSCLSQLNLAASPPSIQPAPQPEVAKLTGAPLVQANTAGDRVFLTYDVASGGPVGIWTAASPNQFATSVAYESAVDLAAASDGTMFATRTNAASEIRGADLALTATPTTAELEGVPNRVLVPGIAMHPSGALIYQPFLTGAPSSSPPPQGGIDILDAHSGSLRSRLFLSEPLAMTSADTDALHASFLAVDENGQRIFAITASGLTIIQLANVPLGIGTISPSNGPASGGTTLTIRGSGFQAATTVSIGGKSASVTFKDMNTLNLVTPALPAGPQQIVITNPNGESVSLDTAFSTN